MKSHYTLTFLLMAVILSTASVLVAQTPGASIPVQEIEQQSWSPEQLDNLVAPIALYPDPLVSQMLVASTYPLEVVEANQWLQRNSGLQGQTLVDAARQQPWDPSIQALVAVPDALERLGQDISWTTDLGDAFLAQQDDVMNAIQRMRIRAQTDSRLYSTAQQTVSTEDRGGRQVIEILPASPDIIYVPVYDPLYIWGPPVYGYYPALYYPAFGFHFSPGFNLAFCFGGWGGWTDWGWGLNWFNHSIVVDTVFFRRYGFHDVYLNGYRGRTVWRHDPAHRLRIPYSNSRVADRFGGTVRGVRNPGRAIPAGTQSRIPGRTPGQDFHSRSPQEYRSQSRPQSRYQAPRQSTRATEQHGGVQRVVPIGPQEQRSYRAPRTNLPESRTYGQSPRTGSLGNARERGFQVRRSDGSSVRTYRAPQVQRNEAPRAYRSGSGFSGQRLEGNSGFRGNGRSSPERRGGRRR